MEIECKKVLDMIDDLNEDQSFVNVQKEILNFQLDSVKRTFWFNRTKELLDALAVLNTKPHSNELLKSAQDVLLTCMRKYDSADFPNLNTSLIVEEVIKQCNDHPLGDLDNNDD